MSGTTPQQSLNNQVSALAHEIESLGSGFATVVLDDQDAQTQAASAAASASSAATSASAASTSATNAASSASAAATSATNAGSSATAASNSATTASNSASAAASSASAASGSASSASSAASSAQSALSAMQSGMISPVTAAGAHGYSIPAGQSYSCSCSFTAPVNGWVVGFGHVNLSSQSTVNQTFNLYINGNNMSGDATLLPQGHMGVLYVGAGTVVTITFTGQNTGSAAGPAQTQYCGGFFIPATL